MLIKYTCDSKIKITNVTHGLPVPVYWQTDSTPNLVVVLRLHDTGVRFHTGVKLGSLSKSLWRPLLRQPEVKKPRNDAVRMLGNDLSP